MSDNNIMVTSYSVKLMIKDLNITDYTDGIMIDTSRDSFMQTVTINCRLTKEQYDKYLTPYRDMIKLSIISSKGCDRSGSFIPDIDASFSYDLTVIAEDSTLNTDTITEEVPNLDRYRFTCTASSVISAMDRLVIDKCFYNKSVSEMTEDILSESGCPYEVESDYINGDAIEQCFIPPCRTVNAIRHIDHYFRIFGGNSPLYFYYGLDGEIHLGSCVKNNLEPLSVYLSGDRSSWRQVNSTRAGGNDEYRYSIINAEMDDDITMASRISGMKQTYTYSPMDRLYSRTDMTMTDYSSGLSLPSNEYGSNKATFTSIARISSGKTRWLTAHNGMPDSGNDNNMVFADAYISSVYSSVGSMTCELEGIIRFNDILRTGRPVKMAAAINTSSYAGDYFLESSRFTLIPVSSKEYWTGKASVTLRSGIQFGVFTE